VLAYVFWHRPRAGVEIAAYEEAQRSFHASLEMTSASFRVAELPFGDGGGYEDWYLVADWSGLGALNEAAVDGPRRAPHDRVAEMSVEGWGAVYSLLRGPAEIPDGARWREKPRDRSYEEFVATLPQATVWQRQMVLGPGPELCLASTESSGRERVWPSS
jgi:hypothetical protein